MYGYFSDYLQLTTPGGCTTRLFDGCRTLANAAAGAANQVWEPNLESESWQGCCCWTYLAESYDPAVNPDPWYDPLNPATSEVAGALVDPPDADGNGFYIEPAASLRVREGGFVPLEMFITFTVVSLTARGERAFINWLTSTLTDETAECDGFTAEVRTECPCENESTINGEPTEPIDAGEPEETGAVCQPSEELQPFDGTLPIFTDLGRRQLLSVRFTGLEQLTDDILWECAGNRYKISFEVDAQEFYGDETELFTLGGPDTWDNCDCLCDPITICEPCDTVVCGPTDTSDTATLVAPTRIQSSNTLDGLICLPGRWSSPERFMMNARLTAPLPSSLNHRLAINITNGNEPVQNARLVVWEAVDGVQRPDTNPGWGYYRCEIPVYDRRIIRLDPFETIDINPDCTTLVTCVNGQTHAGPGTVEPVTDCVTLGCGNRYWVALMLTCDPLGHGSLDLSATVSTVPVWRI